MWGYEENLSLTVSLALIRSINSMCRGGHRGSTRLSSCKKIKNNNNGKAAVAQLVEQVVK